MDVSDISATQRLGIGIVLTLVSQVIMVLGRAHIGPDLGPITRLGAISILLGVGFLGAALEPPLTRRFGADDWNTLSGGKQTIALFVMAITAIVLYGVVSTLGSMVVSLLV